MIDGVGGKTRPNEIAEPMPDIPSSSIRTIMPPTVIAIPRHGSPRLSPLVDRIVGRHPQMIPFRRNPAVYS